jgi:hypothetical protein
MVLHELSTNAAKYGAFANEEGRVEIAWRRLEADEAELTRTERGGPKAVVEPVPGFGQQADLARDRLRPAGQGDHAVRAGRAAVPSHLPDPERGSSTSRLPPPTRRWRRQAHSPTPRSAMIGAPAE